MLRILLLSLMIFFSASIIAQPTIMDGNLLNELTRQDSFFLATSDSLNKPGYLSLTPDYIELKEVKILGKKNHYQTLCNLDIKLKPVTNAQQLLQMVPGLFIGQHAGGGKAEQIFLRGFDIDHGTDIALAVDDIPVNMVSHAHGQGYADLHFLIPELIEQIDYRKGPYETSKGNFSTAGSVDFKTYDSVSQSSVKLEAGMFNHYRLLGIGKLPVKNAYIAAEYLISDGYFEDPQDLKRINVFGKSNLSLNRHQLNLSGSYFTSRWNASGQIPERAVLVNKINRFGSIDPDEGGKTDRMNINISVISNLKNKAILKNKFYASHYDFELFSNFSFYMLDTLNGDQVKQKEDRKLYGFSTNYHQSATIGKKLMNLVAGLGFRYDKTNDSELSRTINRQIISEQIMLGDISETNIYSFVENEILLNPYWSVSAGLRFDQINSCYSDQLNGAVINKQNTGIMLPKLSVRYQASEKTRFYLQLGKGFHSNDTRSITGAEPLKFLPAAYGVDAGSIIKPFPGMIIHTALWYLSSAQELIYVGDEGIVEPGNKSFRAGVDFNIRYQPLRSFIMYADLNYAYARNKENKDEPFIPLAPSFSSSGGVNWNKSFYSAGFRYRCLADRPANEINSVMARGYFIADAVLRYTREKTMVQLCLENLFNSRWKETQFYAQSQLKDEQVSQLDIHFIPGTPFSARIAFTYSF